MKKNYSLITVLIYFMLLYSFSGIAQNVSSPVPEVISPTHFDISPPLISIPISAPPDQPVDEEFNEELKERLYPNSANALPQGPDPVWQQQMGSTQLNRAPLINYEGNPNGWFPPDCNGEVSADYYFQAINVSFQIFNKTGTSLYGPTNNNTIWTGLPGGTDSGTDPVILYDQHADRWFYSDFTHYAPYYVRIAVSTTNDPTGTWYRWTYLWASQPDFAKYGVWSDGYYMASNTSGQKDIAVFDRTAMIAGNSSPLAILFTNSWRPNSGFHCIMPFDNDGQWASGGTPGQFITINDDAWGGSDQLWLYTLTANWANPLSSTFTRSQTLNVAAFDANFGPTWDNIYQNGTTQRLDAVPQVLNFRAQYRNFGTYQSLVCNHTVDVDNTDHAGVRWYELRNTGGGWYIYQQATYAPDGDSRWMGSIAQNGYGDIAMGYSVSSSNTHPSIRFTGRKKGDALGTMTIAEQNIWAGAYSQSGGNRWGDYSMTSVDPSDDKTFWHTNEYIGSGNVRHTRVAAFSFGTACTASGGCDEYISRVQAGSIDNSTACLNYADYTSTHSTNLPVNGVLHVTVTNGNPIYPSDQCGIWVDWNRNGSFYDAGEAITVTGSGSVGPYTATIVPPSGQTFGNCTMRVRITYTGALDPCGVTQYGEVEDYNLNLTTKAPNVWTGNFNNYWGNGPNWSLEHIPTADEDVIIPNVNMPCIVDYTTKVCNNLTSYSGSNVLVSGGTLTVNGNMDIHGQLSMDNSVGVMNVLGDIYWESGSTANITAASVMWIHGFWEFRSGCNVQLANGFVDFTGSTSAYIRTYSPNCSFNNVGIYKTAGNLLGLSNLSTNDLIINGYLGIQPNATFSGASNHSLFLRGFLYNNYHFFFDYGTLVMDGVNQSIKPNVGDYLKNLIISPTGTTTIDNTWSSTLIVNGNLEIQSGIFDPQNNTVEVAGNWTNLVGAGAFTEGSGRVIFNGGNYHQYCSNETFNILEVNKTLGGAFRMNGTNVICQSYDWTAGAVDVLTGSFTANDLADNGLFGSYYLNAGGTINLYNTNGWVDLNGYLYIYGGNFNVYGGNGSDSYWPYTSNGGITMSGGTLDFKDVGVYVNNTPTYSFTENITNGTIKTSRSFGVSRADFTPGGGTIEFYGDVDGNFYTQNGGYVNNVIINKSVADNSGSAAKAIIRDRENSTVTDAPLTNTVSVFNSVAIKGNVTIQSGILSAGATTINVAGDWNNTVGTTGFVEGTSTVVFDGALAADVLSAETFYNLNLNKTYSLFDGLELFYDVAVTNDLHIIDGSLELNDPSNLYVTGNVTINLNAGLNANDLYGPVVSVGKNWTNSNTSYTIEYGFDPGYYSTVIFNGNVDQYLSTNCSQEDFNNLTINKSVGKFRSNANTQSYGNVLIQQGNWEDNIAGLTHSVYRNFTVAPSGTFITTFVGNTVEFTGYANSILTYSGAAGYFRHLLVSKPVGYSVTQTTDVSTQFGGNLTIASGLFNLNGNFLFISGDIAVNNTGTLSLPAASTLVLTEAKSMNINSGGRLEITGTAVSPTIIRANLSTSRYALNVNSGATIAADYCVFKNMGINGVYVSSTGSVDPAHTFKGCTFQDGATGGSLLTINNDQVMTIRNAVFPANTWSGNWNVSKALNSGFVYFVDFSGGFSGEAYDNDYWERIIWVPALTATATATPGAVCSGSSSQLNVNRTGGHSSFTYLWSPATGLSNTTIINPVASPLATTTYYVTVTDDLGTTATSSILITVNPIVPVSVTIAASSNPAPPATYVTFTATPVNGGVSPAYQWKVNGVNVGTGLSTYSYLPSYNDHVTCVLTSNYSCVSGNPATSNTITMMIVPTNTSVTGNVPSPLSLCFDATNTITVAGGGSTFVVASGGRAVMIAGMKISYLNGATVQLGGYMHGYITNTNAYCGSLPPTMVAVATGEPEQTSSPASPSFSIYPNPTTGRFTLIQKGDHTDGIVRVEVIGMRGERLRSEILINERNREFNVSDLSVGLYFVKVVKDDYLETFKLILTR
ncbi:MAG: GEVED domain-containing protein [Bacteroidota bacterium]